MWRSLSHAQVAVQGGPQSALHKHTHLLLFAETNANIPLSLFNFFFINVPFQKQNSSCKEFFTKRARFIFPLVNWYWCKMYTKISCSVSDIQFHYCAEVPQNIELLCYWSYLFRIRRTTNKQPSQTQAICANASWRTLRGHQKERKRFTALSQWDVAALKIAFVGAHIFVCLCGVGGQGYGRPARRGRRAWEFIKKIPNCW